MSESGYEIWVRDGRDGKWEKLAAKDTRTEAIGAALTTEERYGTGNVEIRRDGKSLELL